jgi:predicted DNA-binding transcriptional regulator AlpA
MVKLNKMDALITPKELSRLVGLRPRSLEEWRRLGKGPSYVRLSGQRHVRYPAGAVKAWLDALGDSA